MIGLHPARGSPSIAAPPTGFTVMSEAQFLTFEPDLPGNTEEIRWFEPLAETADAAEVAFVDFDSSFEPGCAGARRAAVPWREMTWVGFADAHEPDATAEKAHGGWADR